MKMESKFRSIEEQFVYSYFLELKTKGYVEEIIYEPFSIEIFPGITKKRFKYTFTKNGKRKVYSKSNLLISKREYTPDFLVKWTEEALDVFCQEFNKEEINIDIPFFYQYIKFGKDVECSMCSLIEVKAEYDYNNMTRHFISGIQPWYFQTKGIFINLTKPIDLFESTFVPKEIISEMYYRKSTKRHQKGEKKYDFEYIDSEKYILNKLSENHLK